MRFCPTTHAAAFAHPGTFARRGLRTFLLLVALCFLAPTLFAQVADDWQSRVRTCVSNKDLAAATAIVEQRLQAAPDDLEARGWHGRLLAWKGNWHSAESEYRYVLHQAPNDVDILTGLADVLIWQQRYDEALDLLAQALALQPKRVDILTRRGRALRSLHHNKEARQAFRQVLALEPANADARLGLASLRPEARHELRLGTDNDFFNYTDTALAQGVSLTSRWNSRWTTSFSQGVYQRFGQDATQFGGSTTWRFSKANALTVGGAVAHDSGVIPRAQAFFELGRGFRFGGEGLIRAIETSYQQRWLWFADARILTFTPAVTVYLPHDWTWFLSITPARSRFPLTDLAWQTSGLTRLSFPLLPRITANAFYAVGTENFAVQDQIGRFAARTMGGGLRYQFSPRQDITGYLAGQDRSKARSQTSLGMSYGIRF